MCFPMKFAKFFKNIYFEKHLWTTAPVEGILNILLWMFSWEISEIFSPGRHREMSINIKINKYGG